MEKISEDTIVKTAHLMGVTQAMLNRGYSQEGVKLAYVESGLFPEDVAAYFVKAAAETDFTKEAFLGNIAAIGMRVAPWLLRGAKSIGRWAGGAKGQLMQGGALSQAAGKVVGGVGAGAGKAVKGLGRQAYKLTTATRQAGRAWEDAQGMGAKAKLLGSGAVNFGKGLAFAGGKGVGGGLGRTALYGSMGANAVGMMRGGGQQAPQMQQMQQMQQMYPQQRMYGG